MATIREIFEMLGEECLDAEFLFHVFDGHRNSEYGVITADYNEWFRHHGGPDGKTPYLRVNVSLIRHRLVKERAA